MRQIEPSYYHKASGVRKVPSPRVFRRRDGRCHRLADQSDPTNRLDQSEPSRPDRRPHELHPMLRGGGLDRGNIRRAAPAQGIHVPEERLVPARIRQDQ